MSFRDQAITIAIRIHLLRWNGSEKDAYNTLKDQADTKPFSRYDTRLFVPRCYEVYITNACILNEVERMISIIEHTLKG